MKTPKPLPRDRLRRTFRGNAPLLGEVRAAQGIHSRGTYVYSRLEAVRLAIVSKLPFEEIGENALVELSRASVYRFLRIARTSGINALCAMPSGSYREKTAKIRPQIGEKLRAEIKNKRITSSREAIHWLQSEHSIRMKTTGIYAWLKRNRLRLKRRRKRRQRFILY